ncbi:MAG: hypothetical protein K6U74_14205, partial [Firmicutes bacterium]|nr:hypothetical protein [Bacillota bacterium]
MQAEEKPVGYGNLKLVSPYEIQTLKQLKIVKKVNEHTRLYLTGILPEEKKDSYIERVGAHDTIEIQQVKDGSLVRTLFKGLVTQVGLQAVRGIYSLEIEALSHTFDMDVKRKSRSFQNKDMPYGGMIEEVLRSYPGADCIDNASGSSNLEKFVIQYNETDWQFLKRMASRFRAVLIPEAASDTPKFWFGLPEGRPGELTDYHYSVKKSLGDYMKTVWDYGDELDEEDVTCYAVESVSHYSLGDRVRFKGKERVVAQSIAEMKNGTLTYEYILASEKGIRQNPYQNKSIVGAALEGKIIDVAKDTVRLHLNIDEAQKKEEAGWFPYSTFYTAEGNSGFYCMPKPGEHAKLYFPSSDEEEALVISSVRKDGQTSQKTADPGTRYWGNEYGKELVLGGNQLLLNGKDSKEGKIFIKLQDEDGIEIHSDKPIVFRSEKDITLEIKKKLAVTGKEGVYLRCGASSILLDGVTDIHGTQVEMEGLTKAPVEVEDLPEEEEPPPEEPKKEGFNWGGLLDGVQLALDVVGLIPGVGEIADLANAGVSALRGDWAGAALSLAACIPFAGWAATGAKVARKGMKAFKAGRKI